MKSNLISKHEYFFPFGWQTIQDVHHEKPNQLHPIDKAAFKKIETWREITSKQYTEKYYNERVYFYSPVQEILYPTLKSDLLRVFVKENTSESDYICIDSIGGVYKVALRDVQLKIYSTGIGLLSFILINDETEDRKGIISINALSKTVYPYRLPLEEIYKDFFPKAVSLKIGDTYVEERFNKDYTIQTNPINDYLMALLGKQFTVNPTPNKDKLYINPLMNNRMFVLCIYYNQQLLHQIKNDQIEYKVLSQFLNFSNKDKGENQDRIDLPHVIYSIGRFCMITITHPQAPTYSYNQLITLALIQRTSILHFSNQVAFISALTKKQLIDAIHQMYEIYIQFMTRVYFEEVTVDVEGTRIYNSLIAQLQIQKELKQLDFEMQEIHEYAMLIENNQSRNRMDFLTIVGAALVIPTFVTGFFGMNILQDKFMTWWKHKEVALWFNSYVMIPIIVVLTLYLWGNKETKAFHLKRSLLIIVLSISLLIGWIFGCGL